MTAANSGSPDSLVGDPLAETAALDALIGLSFNLNRSIALHRNASADMLRRLAQSPDKTTRRNVALNPQTPTDVLLALAPTFAGEFFRNPVFDLLLMEDPNMLNGLPVSVMKNILKREDCPDSFLIWAAKCGDKSHQLALVSRPVLTKQLLEIVAKGPHAKPAEVAAGRLMSGDCVV
jgi:hypothetical protein